MEKYHFDRKIVSLELMTFSSNVGGYAPEYASELTPIVFNSRNEPPFLSATTTLVVPDLFFFLRINMPQSYTFLGLRHPKW